MFLKRRSFFGFDSLKGCLLSQLEAVDVDTPEDWEQLETNFKLLT